MEQCPYDALGQKAADVLTQQVVEHFVPLHSLTNCEGNRDRGIDVPSRVGQGDEDTTHCSDACFERSSYCESGVVKGIANTDRRCMQVAEYHPDVVS